MNRKDGIILVTGATGTLGSEIVKYIHIQIWDKRSK